MDIGVQVRESDDAAYVVELSGEIDVYTSPKVKDAIGELIDEGHYNLVINLEKVRYIDSTGLGVLIGGTFSRLMARTPCPSSINSPIASFTFGEVYTSISPLNSTTYAASSDSRTWTLISTNLSYRLRVFSNSVRCRRAAV